MKKFFTILAFVSFLALSMSACTEEEIKPSSETPPAGSNSAKF